MSVIRQTQYGTRQFDNLVGNEENPESRDYVCCGHSAVYRCGLSDTPSVIIECWTPYKMLHDINTYITKYFYNPTDISRSTEDCVQSSVSPHIWEPTQERAILEFIAFHDYFMEGYLIEALKDYMWVMHNGEDCSKLYAMASKYNVTKEQLDYWIKEAIEDKMIHAE